MLITTAANYVTCR